MTKRRPSSIDRALVGLALDMLNWLEDLPEEQIELETVVQLEENIAYVVGGLSPGDRELFIQAAKTVAKVRDQTTPGSGRRLLEALAALDLEEPE